MCLREERAVLLDGQRRRNDAVLAIVVAPSQELAIQIVREARADGGCGHGMRTPRDKPRCIAVRRSAKSSPGL